MLTKPLTAAAVLLAFATPTWSSEIWVSNEKSNTVSVIDVETLEVTRTLNVGERPRGIIFSQDYSRLYVCASDDDTVQVLDPASGEVLHNLRNLIVISDRPHDAIWRIKVKTDASIYCNRYQRAAGLFNQFDNINFCVWRFMLAKFNSR